MQAHAQEGSPSASIAYPPSKWVENLEPNLLKVEARVKGTKRWPESLRTKTSQCRYWPSYASRSFETASRR